MDALCMVHKALGVHHAYRHHVLIPNSTLPHLLRKTMKISLRTFFNSERSIFIAAPILALLSFSISHPLSLLVAWLVELAGYSAVGLLPHFELDAVTLLVAVLLGPLVETWLLAVGLWAIGRFASQPWRISLASGVLWAAIHGWQAPLWAVGTIWPFTVFSYAYLTWRSNSRADAVGIAWLTHVFHNALSVTMALMFSA
jgi:hypothetical protein